MHKSALAAKQLRLLKVQIELAISLSNPAPSGRSVAAPSGVARPACIWHCSHDTPGLAGTSVRTGWTGGRGRSGRLQMQLPTPHHPECRGTPGWSVNVFHAERGTQAVAGCSPGPRTCMSATHMCIPCLDHAKDQVLLGGALPRGT